MVDMYDPNEEQVLMERLRQIRAFRKSSAAARPVADAGAAEDSLLGDDATAGGALGMLPVMVAPLLAQGVLPNPSTVATEPGRRLAAGIGAALGSQYGTAGAAAGGALGNLIFDFLNRKD